MTRFENPALLPQAQIYIRPAQAYPQIWRLVVGISLFVVFYALFVSLIPLAATAVWDVQTVQDFQSGLDKLDTRPEAIFVLISFIGMIMGVVAAALILHHRGFKSLVGPSRSALKLFISGILFIWVYQVVAALCTTLFLPSQETLLQQYEFTTWMSWLPVLIPLLLIQVGAEELVVRGYVQQQLAALTRIRFFRWSVPVKGQSRLVWWILPSLLFGLLHYDTGVFGRNAILVFAVTTIIGLLAADMTMRTGSLWAAIGLHFGNNFSGFALLGQTGHLSGFALFLSPLDISDEAAVRPYLLAQVIFAVLLLIVYLVFVNRRNRV